MAAEAKEGGRRHRRTRQTTDQFASWDSFIVKQDDNGCKRWRQTTALTFADIIEGMAVANGIGTLEMAEQMKDHGRQVLRRHHGPD